MASKWGDEVGECGGGDAPSAASTFLSKMRPNAELDNFLKQVDDISNLITGLASEDPSVQERALRKADIFLHQKDSASISDDPDKVQCRVTQERTQINKIPDKPKDEGDMSQEAFMKYVEKDANERSEARKKRKKESDECRRKGNANFSKKDYAGALYNYNEAIKLIKDSPCLYNNRALTYLRLGLYDATISDCNRALELENYSLRARMYKAKALFLSGQAEKCREELEEARKELPGHLDMINEYQEEIFNMGRDKPPEDFYSEQEKVWQNAANFTGQFAPKSSTSSRPTSSKEDLETDKKESNQD